MKKSLAVIAATVLLVACAGTNFKWEDTAKVHDGMTEAEVVAILGAPYQRVRNGQLTILTWSYATGFGGAKAVSYRLINDQVIGAAAVNPPK